MTATITYRKTRQGEWVAFGPASVVRPGFVTITKRSGETKQEIVERVGREFQVDSTTMVYGYLAKSAPTRPAGNGGGLCDECQRPSRRLITCADSSGIGGRCCPRCASMSPYERSFC